MKREHFPWSRKNIDSETRHSSEIECTLSHVWSKISLLISTGFIVQAKSLFCLHTAIRLALIDKLSLSDAREGEGRIPRGLPIRESHVVGILQKDRKRFLQVIESQRFARNIPNRTMRPKGHRDKGNTVMRGEPRYGRITFVRLPRMVEIDQRDALPGNPCLLQRICPRRSSSPSFFQKAQISEGVFAICSFITASSAASRASRNAGPGV